MQLKGGGKEEAERMYEFETGRLGDGFADWTIASSVDERRRTGSRFPQRARGCRRVAIEKRL